MQSVDGPPIASALAGIYTPGGQDGETLIVYDLKAIARNYLNLRCFPCFILDAAACLPLNCILVAAGLQRYSPTATYSVGTLNRCDCWVAHANLALLLTAAATTATARARFKDRCACESWALTKPSAPLCHRLLRVVTIGRRAHGSPFRWLDRISDLRQKFSYNARRMVSERGCVWAAWGCAASAACPGPSPKDLVLPPSCRWSGPAACSC